MKSGVIAVCALLLMPAAHAHHSIVNVYDEGRPITIEGAVLEFRFIHPHPILIVRVTTPTGGLQTWRAEMDNRFELARAGLDERTFKPGDRVIVHGDLARNEPQSLYMWRLQRPADGLLYEQIGGTPRLTRPGKEDS